MRHDGKMVVVAGDRHRVDRSGRQLRALARSRASRRGEILRVRGKLAAFEARLEPTQFVRIHRSAIVNLSHVRELSPWFHGDQQIVLSTGRGAHRRAGPTAPRCSSAWASGCEGQRYRRFLRGRGMSWRTSHFARVTRETPSAAAASLWFPPWSASARTIRSRSLAGADRWGCARPSPALQSWSPRARRGSTPADGEARSRGLRATPRDRSRCGAREYSPATRSSRARAPHSAR